MTRNLRKQAIFGLILLLVAISTIALIKINEASRKTHILLKVEVKSGDNLWKIVQRHSINQKDLQAAVYEVKKLNNKKSDLIYPGDVILIPCTDISESELARK
ncbi:MAG: LysM peptidoglycan-binding domain-containing protein [Candidatus Subteraquimicrobiales bacterium]|nr:LysM peptidoglycan-binding domain-containing protein [Candidatus Subteraquimicrobiales bacterium]